jgi:hypothetical protein
MCVLVYGGRKRGGERERRERERERETLIYSKIKKLLLGTKVVSVMEDLLLAKYFSSFTEYYKILMLHLYFRPNKSGISIW